MNKNFIRNDIKVDFHKELSYEEFIDNLKIIKKIKKEKKIKKKINKNIENF